jgi:hypothetical protein
MQLTNREWVGRGLEVLARGPGPYVDRHMSAFWPGPTRWLEVMVGRARQDGLPGHAPTASSSCPPSDRPSAIGPSVSPAYGRAGLRHAGMSTRTRYSTQTTSPSASRLNASSTRRSMPGWPFSFLYKKSRPNSRTAASDCWRVSAPCQQLPDRPAFAVDLTSLTSLNCHGCLPSDEDTMSGLASSRSNSRQMSRLGISLR